MTSATEELHRKFPSARLAARDERVQRGRYGCLDVCPWPSLTHDHRRKRKIETLDIDRWLSLRAKVQSIGAFRLFSIDLWPKIALLIGEREIAETTNTRS